MALVATILLPSFTHAQVAPFGGVPAAPDAVIYQVNIRAFSEQGNLAGVTDRLNDIKSLGVNVVYLMPIYPLSQSANSVNSPYSITDYTGVNSEFGTLADLQHLVNSAHALGMAVILDFVPNHTGWDHPWINTHNDWYAKDASGNILIPNGWADVAQLDFTNLAMQDALISAMHYWVNTANVDGFRFDYAGGPPVDFWHRAVSSLRGLQDRDLLLLAEDNRNENFTTGMDYNFGFSFFGELEKIFHGGDAYTLQYVHQAETAMAGPDQRLVRYTTNHDVNDSHGTPESLLGGDRAAMTAFVLASYMRSTPMVYSGQEVGTPYPIRFPFTLDTIDWSLNPDRKAEYTAVLQAFNHNLSLRHGSLEDYSTNHVVAFTRTTQAQQAFVAGNTRNGALEYTLPATVANKQWVDAYSGEAVYLGNTLALPAYGYRAFVQDNPVTGGGFTVRVKKPDSWGDTMNVYYWDAQPANAISTTGWPGVQMTDVGGGWFEFTFQGVTSTNLIFNDGSNQTANLNRSYDGWYDAGTGNWFGTNPDEFGPAPEPDSGFTVYFKKPEGWAENINLYFYNAVSTDPNTAVQSAGWPGQGATHLGADWYSYTFTNVESATVIFNDGSNQSADHTVTGNSWYQSGTWSDTAPTWTVTFKKPEGWGDNINLYYYNALSGQPGEDAGQPGWPGEPMTALGDGWFGYTFNGVLAATVIVNDGSSQTVDTTLSQDSWYQNGSWSSSLPSWTVTFKKPDSWGDSINVYHYNPIVDNDNVQVSQLGWPGTAMTALGEGWYSYTFNGLLATTVIINDGTSQTVDTTLSGNSWYQDGAWSTDAPVWTVTFKQPDGWGDNINLYFYNAITSPATEAPAQPAWPGIAMTSLGDGWYSHAFSGVLSATVIMNDGVSQTPDATRNADSWYQNGVWLNAAPDFDSDGLSDIVDTDDDNDGVEDADDLHLGLVSGNVMVDGQEVNIADRVNQQGVPLSVQIAKGFSACQTANSKFVVLCKAKAIKQLRKDRVISNAESRLLVGIFRGTRPQRRLR